MSKQRGNGSRDRRPLYQTTADALGRILSTMETGAYLPSEPALAKQLGVSRATLREAMRTYEERGMIVRQQGVGTQLTQPPPVIEAGIEILESLETLASRIDLDVVMGDLTIRERQPDDEEARFFDISAETPVLEVVRVLTTGDRPVTYLIDVLPRDVMPLETFDSNFSGSVLDLLLRRGDPPLSHSRTEITAASAPPEIARPLNIQRGDVLLVFEAWLCSMNGKAVDHSFSYFLPGIFRFHVVRRVGR
jgi:GntR family transcriptional regulator